jgi:hypothetical protein
MELPTVEVEAKISKESIVQLVIAGAIILAFGFMLFSISKFSTN